MIENEMGVDFNVEKDDGVLVQNLSDEKANDFDEKVAVLEKKTGLTAGELADLAFGSSLKE